MQSSPRSLFLCVCLMACASEGSPTGASEAALIGDSPTPEPPSEPAETVLLDDGIEARLVPPPPNADPDRVVELSEAVADLAAGERVLEARHVGAAVVAIHEDHTLWLHEASGRQQLDEHVEAPLSVQGRSVAYARGEMPFFEIARIADVRAGAVEVLTEGYAPAWNPALGPDGSVVFVSAREGSPALYRLAPGSTPERLAHDGAFPSSARAPAYDGHTLRFEDEASQVHEVTLDAPIPTPSTGALR